tara:strand:+ start:4672 stop:5850 length:1179 start_codon:yes stop_codon:yes gene_type:complete
MGWLQSTSINQTKSADDGSFSVKSCISTDMNMFVDDDGIHFQLGIAEKRYKKESIKALKTICTNDSLPSLWKLQMKLEDESWVDILESYDENSLLNMMNGIASKLLLPMKEHTGRLVRRDEHGMGVVEQLAIFPDRWPRPEKLPSIRFDFRKEEDSVYTTIPTRSTQSALLFFWISVLFSVGLGLSMFYLRSIGDRDYNQLIWVFIFPSLTLLYWLFFNSNTGQLESKHRLIISAKNISLQPKFLGIIPLKTRIWEMDDFIDIDSDESGRLTLFIGEKRYSMKMHRREAEWFVGEVATQMEQLMVDKINSARMSMNLELKEAFKKFDKDGDGNLSLEELESAIDDFGIGLSKLQMKVLMRDIDTDSDGKINYSEFVDRFSTINEVQSNSEEE